MLCFLPALRQILTGAVVLAETRSAVSEVVVENFHEGTKQAYTPEIGPSPILCFTFQKISRFDGGQVSQEKCTFEYIFVFLPLEGAMRC